QQTAAQRNRGPADVRVLCYDDEVAACDQHRRTSQAVPFDGSDDRLRGLPDLLPEVDAALQLSPVLVGSGSSVARYDVVACAEVSTRSLDDDGRDRVVIL